MRNSLVTESYLTEEIDYWTESADKSRCYALLEEINAKRIKEGEPIVFDVLLNTMSRTFMEVVGFRYTRGDALADIDSEVVQVAVDNMITAFEELDKHDMLEGFYYEGKRASADAKRILAPSKLHSLFTELAWCYCFRVDKDKLARISKHFVPDKTSIAIDTILARHNPERVIEDNNTYKAEFLSFWDDFVQADKQTQTTLLPTYLDDWARILTSDKHEPTGRFVSVGAMMSKRHKSNASLPKEVAKKNHITYKGHWAWEVALMVVFFELDDSEIRDHPLYPVELVDYYRSTA